MIECLARMIECLARMIDCFARINEGLSSKLMTQLRSRTLAHFLGASSSFGGNDRKVLNLLSTYFFTKNDCRLLGTKGLSSSIVSVINVLASKYCYKIIHQI